MVAYPEGNEILRAGNSSVKQRGAFVLNAERSKRPSCSPSHAPPSMHAGMNEQHDTLTREQLFEFVWSKPIAELERTHGPSVPT